MHMENASHLSPLEAITARHRLLEQIDKGVCDKRDLHDALNSSRTTIDRAVRELEQENILHRRNGCCEFTRFGRVAYSEFCGMSQTFKTLDNASNLLSILPENSTLDLSAERCRREVSERTSPCLSISAFLTKAK